MSKHVANGMRLNIGEEADTLLMVLNIGEEADTLLMVLNIGEEADTLLMVLNIGEEADKIVEMWDKWFDAMNLHDLCKGKHHKKDFQKLYKSAKDDQLV